MNLERTNVIVITTTTTTQPLKHSDIAHKNIIGIYEEVDITLNIEIQAFYLTAAVIYLPPSEARFNLLVLIC